MDILKLIAESDETSAPPARQNDLSTVDAPDRPQGLGVTEIASRVGLHVATTHNILRTLAVGDFLVNASGRYHIGPAAARLSLSYRPMAVLAELAAEPMAAMSRATGEAGFLAVLVGDACRLRTISSGHREITVAKHDRTHDNALAVASGRLLAACCRRPQWRGLIQRHLDAGHRCDTNAMQAELESIAAESCCIIRRPRPDGVDAVAVPLYGVDGQIIAALGVNCPNFRADAVHLTDMLLAVSLAAEATSTAMGSKAVPLDKETIARAVSRSFAEDSLAIMP